MGSRIGGWSGASAAQSVAVSNWQQRQQGVSALNSALTAGDLKAAQQAYSGLVGNSPVGVNSPLGQIGAALQSGDLATAQKTAQALQNGRGGQNTQSDSPSKAASPIRYEGGGTISVVV